MKIKEIREFADEELVRKEQDLQEELFKLKFQHGIRPLESPARMPEVKKDIARMKTVMRQRSLAAE